MNLTNNKIKNTYGGVLNIGATGFSGNQMFRVTDGFGNPTPWYLSETGVDVLGTFSVNGVVFDPESGYHGAFYSTATQSNAGTTATNKVSFNGTYLNNNVVVLNNTQVTFLEKATYDIQFSLQFEKTDGGDDRVQIWFQKNGQNVPDSNTEITIQGNNGKFVAAWDFMVSLNANDFIEICWHSSDINVYLVPHPAQINPDRPSIPSAIISALQITNILTGAPGATGPMGAPGPTGPAGATGQSIIGPQGAQGIDGANGAQGAQGAAGINGAQGAQGAIGFQGNDGSNGAQGFQGLRGLQGFQGRQGLVGATGSGTQGFQGIIGLQGPAGSGGGGTGSGTQGFQGPIGPQGLVGSNGTNGLQGFQGLIGATGSNGTNGLQGFQGLIGATGSNGTNGTQGFQGSVGLQGFQGLIGPQGLIGANGTNGTQGFQGRQGLAGATGSNGTNGTQGFQGFIGPQGLRGFQGFQGLTGIDGPPGADAGLSLRYRVEATSGTPIPSIGRTTTDNPDVVDITQISFDVEDFYGVDAKPYWNQLVTWLSIPMNKASLIITTIESPSVKGIFPIIGINYDSVNSYFSITLDAPIYSNGSLTVGNTLVTSWVGEAVGLPGPTGPQGPQGTGPQGAFGPQGFQGWQGSTPFAPSVITLTDAATISWTYSTGQTAKVTINGNRALTINGATNGDYGTLIITHGTTNSIITSFPTTSDFPAGTYSFSANAGTIDIYSWLYDAGIYYWVFNKNFV